MDTLKDILKNKPKGKKPPKYEWQALALEIFEAIPDSKPKKSSIFKCCKQDARLARIAFEDCKELNKMHVQYFLKVFNELIKGIRPKTDVRPKT